MRPPTRLLIVQWVKKAWKALPASLIQKSFKVCALSNEIPEEIGCLKPGNLAHEALGDVVTKLQEARDRDDDETDPFDGVEEDEDEGELDDNQVVVEDD